MTISAEEIASWIKRRADQGQPLISLSPSMARDVVASLTDMKAEIGRLESDLGDYRNVADAANARIAALEAQLEEAVAVLEPFAKEESTWANSVADDYRPGLVEPNQRTAYSKAEFSIGDLRRAAAIRARSEQERK